MALGYGRSRRNNRMSRRRHSKRRRILRGCRTDAPPSCRSRGIRGNSAIGPENLGEIWMLQPWGNRPGREARVSPVEERDGVPRLSHGQRDTEFRRAPWHRNRASIKVLTGNWAGKAPGGPSALTDLTYSAPCSAKDAMVSIASATLPPRIAFNGWASWRASRGVRKKTSCSQGPYPASPSASRTSAISGSIFPSTNCQQGT